MVLSQGYSIEGKKRARAFACCRANWASVDSDPAHHAVILRGKPDTRAVATLPGGTIATLLSSRAENNATRSKMGERMGSLMIGYCVPMYPRWKVITNQLELSGVFGRSEKCA